MAINLDHQRDRLSTSSETLTLNTTGALALPSGTTLQRPGNAINGQLRFNSTDNKIEQYVNNSWTIVGGVNDINDLTDVTISSVSSGDILIANGSGVFENKPNTVDNLSNATIGSYSNGQVLKYNNNAWRNTVLELNDLSDVTISGTPAQDKYLKTNSSGIFVLEDAPVDFTGATSSANGTSGLVPYPQAGEQAKFLRGDGSWATVTTGGSGGTTYDISVASGTTKLRLTGSDSTIDDIEFVGTGATTVSRSNSSKFTIDSTDTQYSAGTGINLSGTTFSAKLTEIDHDQLLNFVPQEHIDWSVSQQGNAHYPIHADNYTDTQYVSSNFDHNQLTNYVANQHIDWTLANQGTIDSSNISFPSDVNTTYSQSVTTSSGNVFITLAGSDSTTDNIELEGSGSVTVSRDSADKIIINATDTQYSAGTGITLTGTSFSANFSEINHNALNNYQTNEHIDWTVSQASNNLDIDPDNLYQIGNGISVTGNTISVNQGTIDHDQLNNFVANEHIDWTADQSLNGILINPNNLFTIGTGLQLSGSTISTKDSEINHDQLNNFVPAEHVDWTQPNQGTIDNTNLNISTSNTTYTTSVPNGTTKIRLTGSDNTNDDIEFVGTGSIIVTRSNDSRISIGSALSAGTGVTIDNSDVISIGQAVSTTSDVTFNDIVVSGNLTVNGTQTVLNTDTLEVEDINIILGKVTTPTNDTGDGGGITLKAATDKTITWSKTTNRWAFNTGVDVEGILHINSEQSSSPSAPADGQGGYLYTKADGKPYWISYDQNEIDLTSGTGGGGGATTLNGLNDVTITSASNNEVLTWNGSSWVNSAAQGGTLGTPTDTTYNDGAYYQAGSTYQNGTSVSGFNTSGSIANAIDAINETMKNIHSNTYVQGAYFTNTTTQGSASPANPLSVTFTILNKGDATHVDWEFKNTSTNNTITVSDSTSTTSYTQDFTEVAGGPIDVTMTMKCSTGSTSNMTEGSYFTYKKTAAVTLFTPAPEIAWTTTNNDQIVDLGSGTASDREIEFDVTSSLYVTYWMIEFGDGSKYPTGADPAGDNTHVQSNWIEWASTKKHTYDYDANGSTVTQDTRWSPKVYGRSTGANGGTGTTNSLQKNNHIEGFIIPFASFTVQGATTGNNDESGDVNVNGDTNTQEGHPVKFTNTTANLGTWGDTTYTWDWGDLTSDTVVTGGAGTAGDVSQQIEHYFTLANDDVAETFNVTLKAENNRTSSNSNTTTATTITVNIDPRAGFSGAFVNQNTSASGSPSYVNPRIGYNFTKYSTSGGADSNGASNIVDFTNSSAGVTGTSPVYAWTFNNGQTSAVADPPNQSFTTAQSYDIKLITQNANSYSGGTDDTEEKTNYITINANPSAPPGLTGYTISVPSGSIAGTSPLACADITDNTAGGGSSPTGGSSVTRITSSSLTTEKTNNWANQFPSNGTYAGVLTAHLNEGSATGTITFDGSNKIGTNGILEVTDERDSNARDSNTYPDNFYKEFKAKAVLTGLSAGFNTIQLKHDDGTETAKTEFVYDDMTDNPTISSFGTVTGSGTYRYMSGIKFYNTGATLTITGLAISNLTGQTYRDTTSPLTISSSTGTPIASQTFTYANLGVNAIPNKNLSPTSSALTVNVNGSGAGKDGILKGSAINVNGTSADKIDTTKIMYWISTPTLDETSIANNITLGSGSQSGKRIKYTWTGTDYDHPAYTAGSNDWYTTYAWDSQTDTLPNTNEAGCYLNEIKHTLEDFSTGYLPVGDNLGTGRSTSDTQYFTLAFKQNSIAKFAIKITGEVTSLYIALPQFTTDTTSTINGWLDCSTNFGGGGVPGAGTGGNGSNGVRRTGTSAQQGSFAVNTALTNAYANLDLGEANTGSMTYPTVLVRFGIANGKSVSAISLEDWSS